MLAETEAPPTLVPLPAMFLAVPWFVLEKYSTPPQNFAYFLPIPPKELMQG